MSTKHGLVVGGALNLRERPSTAANRLILIPNQTMLAVSDYNEDWYDTSYHGYNGYVMKRFIHVFKPLPRTASGWSYGQVTSSALNVRKLPSLSAALWNYYWPKNRIALIKPSVDGWYETLYRGETAFVSAQYIEPMDEPVPASIKERMLFMAIPELGRSNSKYFNGYSGKWCQIFANWLPLHAAMPKACVPDSANCGISIVWFVNDAKSRGFLFKNAMHKARMINAYPAIHHLSAMLTDEEEAYVPVPGDFIFFRWRNASSSVNVSHVGIVRHVDDTALTTFEGNCEKKVASRTFQLNDSRIVGYGRLAYPAM